MCIPHTVSETTTKQETTSMLSTNLVVTDNSTATKPGSLGAKYYNSVFDSGIPTGQIKRRIQATATSTPQELTISHQLTGKSFNQRVRSMVRFDFRKLNVDAALTGGVVPSASVYLVIDRPLNASMITDAEVKNLVGATIDVITVAGQLDAILAREG